MLSEVCRRSVVAHDKQLGERSLLKVDDVPVASELVAPQIQPGKQQADVAGVQLEELEVSRRQFIHCRTLGEQLDTGTIAELNLCISDPVGVIASRRDCKSEIAIRG